MISRDFLSTKQIAEICTALDVSGSTFKNSEGVRSKSGLNGKQSIFETLKLFDMSRELRRVVRDIVGEEEDSRALETYFLRFKEGAFLDDYKSIDRCPFICKSTLLKGTATVTVDGTSYDMKSGDTLEIPLKQVHSVLETNELVDFLVLLRIK